MNKSIPLTYRSLSREASLQLELGRLQAHVESHEQQLAHLLVASDLREAWCRFLVSIRNDISQPNPSPDLIAIAKDDLILFEFYLLERGVRFKEVEM